MFLWAYFIRYCGIVVGGENGLENKHISSLPAAYKRVGLIKQLQYSSEAFCTNDESSHFCRVLPLLCKDSKVNNFLLDNNRFFCMPEYNTNSLVFSFVAEILHQAKFRKYVCKLSLKNTQLILLYLGVSSRSVLLDFILCSYSAFLSILHLGHLYIHHHQHLENDFKLRESSEK